MFRPSTFNNLKPLLQRHRQTLMGRTTLYATIHHQPITTQSETNTPSLSITKQSIRNQTHFSTTLATHLLSKKHDSNVVFSPVSIHVVLSILAAGSTGRTLDQLLAFLKTNDTGDLNSLYSQAMCSVLADGSVNGGPRLSFANGLWVDQTLSLKPSFKQVMDTVYKAACEQVDFRTKTVQAANKVNSWAEKQTNGLIKQVIYANSLNKLTRLIFANAVYFKGAWTQEFDQSMTEESDFHLLHGNKVQVPFMTNNEDQFVHEYDNFKVLGLRYAQGKDDHLFTMYFFLPNAKDGLQSLVQNMGSTSNFFDRHIPRKKVELGQFLIAKYKISSEFEASAMLKELGLVLPFEGGDGLTEMVDSSAGESLSVSRIDQKAFVEVNEEGTEAAAVTYGLVCGSSFQVQKRDKIDFVADHPFLFVIREDVTGVVLFMGQVIDPRPD